MLLTMLVAFNIIFDDIVFPDGRTAMGVLGGGGPQAAFGMRLFADQVGLVAGVGADLPQSVWDWLTDSGIDHTGVQVAGDSPTPRAWQITESDGRRTQVWRVRPSGPGSVPEIYHHAQGYHFGIHPESPPPPMAAELRRNGLLSLETFRPASQPPPPESLFALLSAADIFSANLAEAQSLVGGGSPRGIARRLVEAAESKAQLIVLRLGAEGSWVVEGQTGQAVRLPAWPASVMDAVGAGNAYCGGFLAGWVDTHDIARAGACGAAAASLVVEQVGLPVVTDLVRTQAQQRATFLLTQIEYTSL
jgi:cytidine kinase